MQNITNAVNQDIYKNIYKSQYPDVKNCITQIK